MKFQLKLYDPTHEIDNKFLEYLSDFLIKNIVLNKKELQRWDEYFNREITGSRKISTEQIIKMSLYNLVLQRDFKTVYIKINPNVYYPYTQLKLKELVNTVTYGNLEMSGYPVLHKLFTKTAKDMGKIYEFYKGAKKR